MDIEALHLFVDDAERWQRWFIDKLDFQAGCPHHLLELSDRAVHRGAISILLSAPSGGRTAVQRFRQQHPEGVGEVVFRVRNLGAIAARLHYQGESFLQVPQENGGGTGPRYWVQVQGWGKVCHTFIEVPQGQQEPLSCSDRDHLPWLRIDHVVLNVPQGELEVAAHWYETRLGFQRHQQFVIETPRSGLRSLVLKHPEGTATLPVNEPTSPNSQIQEFLTHHRGAGIQHGAFQTQDLVRTVAQLRDRGISFLSVPTAYYRQLETRSGFWQKAGDWDAIARQQILVDWPPETPEARLLQTFTQPLFAQPTFFLEFIERQTQQTAAGLKQASGFGEGNFQALFEAIEREQAQRGSLHASCRSD